MVVLTALCALFGFPQGLSLAPNNEVGLNLSMELTFSEPLFLIYEVAHTPVLPEGSFKSCECEHAGTKIPAIAPKDTTGKA